MNARMIQLLPNEENVSEGGRAYAPHTLPHSERERRADRVPALSSETTWKSFYDPAGSTVYPIPGNPLLGELEHH